MMAAVLAAAAVTAFTASPASGQPSACSATFSVNYHNGLSYRVAANFTPCVYDIHFSPRFTHGGSHTTGYYFTCGAYIVSPQPLCYTGCGSNDVNYFFIPECGPDRYRFLRERLLRDGRPYKVRPVIKTKPAVMGVRGFAPGTVELFRFAQPGETYRWRRAQTDALVVDGVQPSGSAVSGASSAHMTITDIDTPDEGLYVLEASTDGGASYGMVDAVRVHVDRPVANIVSMPQDREACLGGTTDFLIVADEPVGAPAIYRWYRGGEPLSDGALAGVGVISGATTPLLTITALEAGAGGVFACDVLTGGYVNNTFGATLIISDNAMPPVVLAAPQSIAVTVGESAYMIADIDVAPGHIPSFQWRKDGVAIHDDGRIEGTQTEQLVFNWVVAGDAALYDCVVARGCASTTTDAAIMTVTTTPACDSIDFNNDTLFPDNQDIEDFLSVFGGGPCTNDPNCGDIDFNNDGLFPDNEDLETYLRVFGGGNC